MKGNGSFSYESNPCDLFKDKISYNLLLFENDGSIKNVAKRNYEINQRLVITLRFG